MSVSLHRRGLLSFFTGWRAAFCTGVWEYQEHRRTGRRRVVRVNRGGHQPQDLAWLAGCPAPAEAAASKP